MVKGVNKNIIEINDTGSEIFERIVFYVSPSFCNLSAKRLLKETDKFVFLCKNQVNSGKKSLRRRRIIRRRVFLLSIALGIAGVVALLIALL